MGELHTQSPKAFCFLSLTAIAKAAREVKVRKRCVLEWIRWSPRSVASHGGPIKAGVPYFMSSQVREIHRRYLEEGTEGRDVLIVAHGHFSRCLIPRWLDQPLILGKRAFISTRSYRPLATSTSSRVIRGTRRCT